MRVLVVSDSHTDVDTMDMVVRKMSSNMVIHLGDHIVDAVLLQARHPDMLIECIKGNCDTNSDRPREKLLRVGSTTIFMTHGDEYRVEEGLNELITAGKRSGAGLILFGHTHTPLLYEIHGITVMNPGRIGRKSSKIIDATFGLVDTDAEGTLRCSIVRFDSIAGENTEA